MTDEEILKACDLRIKGWTFPEIGKELRYSERNIRYHIEKYVVGDRTVICGPGQYPNIQSWMKRNRFTVKSIAAEFGASASYIYRSLDGRHAMPENLIEWFQARTGMSREEILERKP